MTKATARNIGQSAARNAVWVIHGPNLNLLGSREPGIYGKDTLTTINKRLMGLAKASQCTLECFQSNFEGELIERVHAAKTQGISFIIINPAGLTHTSVALRDALAGVDIPFIEVHLSNIHKREPFRAKSYFSDLAVGIICGLGSAGYDLALQFALTRLPAQAGRTPRN
jgi:3-dehydroquinate dehydratase-2